MMSTPASISIETMPAFSGCPTHWHNIDWAMVNRTVRGTQVRIAKAAKDGNWRKVKALQRMLTRSFCARALAVRRVTENRGKRTAGVDGEIWETPAMKWKAITRLTRRGYRPSPLRRVHIPKANGKRRALGIPTMLDRAMQALYLLALAPVAETTGDPNSYGFREMRSTADAIVHCHTALCRGHSPQWVLEADIKGCFDHISHDWLLAHVPMDRVMLRRWLKAGVVEFGNLKPTEEGTPQGGIISPTLANLALDGLQTLLLDTFGGDSKKGKRNKVRLVRYADDFIITGASKELLENEVRPLVEAFLAKRGLTLSPEKTKTTHIERGFDFLGWNVRRYGNKVLAKPSTDNVKAARAKIKEIIRKQYMLPQEVVISSLNPVLRGWANYHHSQVASDAFAMMDAYVFRRLWHWARRRHPKKGRRWVAKRYFRTVGDRNWVFACDSANANGAIRRRELHYCGGVKIQRHVKIKADANPYDPNDELYFEDRLVKQMERSAPKRRQVNFLHARQKGLCLLCNTAITRETGWHRHHVVPRTLGGVDTVDNLILLHPNCHQQLHHRCTNGRLPGSS
ncbi:MAG: group II intron reverse transcriptase/maturase, partial [Spongiibacter marinus]|uniref:group II intron reverse transcriptase/maturase n=1 Tax=Spongiibacter marinus TaxID=354246 RepID=UPI003C646541